MHNHDHNFFIKYDGENLITDVLPSSEMQRKYGIDPEKENGKGFKIVEDAVDAFVSSDSVKKISWEFMTADYMAAIYTLGVAISIAHLDPIDASEAIANFSRLYFSDK